MSEPNSPADLQKNLDDFKQWQEQVNADMKVWQQPTAANSSQEPLTSEKTSENEEKTMEQKVTPLRIIEPAEVIRLEEKNQQLSQQLAEKDNQIAQLQHSLEIAKQQSDTNEKNLYEMISANDQMKQIYEAKQTEVATLQNQLASAGQTVAADDSALQEQLTEQKRLNEEITQVLVQVRRDAKDTEDKANIEAQSIINNAKIKTREILVDAAKELEEIKKNLKIYQTQMISVKEESNQLFDSLNEKAQKLIDTTIEQ